MTEREAFERVLWFLRRTRAGRLREASRERPDTWLQAEQAVWDRVCDLRGLKRKAEANVTAGRLGAARKAGVAP